MDINYYWVRQKNAPWNTPWEIAEFRQENYDVLYFCGDEVDRDPANYDMVPVENFLGRQPDLRMDLYMSEIGYQAEIYREGTHLGGGCRDFGDSYEGDAYENKLNELYKGIIKLIKGWK